MKKHLKLLTIVAVLVIGVGVAVGYAESAKESPPSQNPSAAADDVLVAGPDGEPLRCNGKLVRVKREKLPPLTPAQAVSRGKTTKQGHKPEVKVARCAGTGVVDWVDATASP